MRTTLQCSAGSPRHHLLFAAAAAVIAITVLVIDEGEGATAATGTSYWGSHCSLAVTVTVTSVVIRVEHYRTRRPSVGA